MYSLLPGPLKTLYALVRWGTVRRFFDYHIPYFDRVLLIESGSRYLFDDLLEGLYASHPELKRLDLVTCFTGTPRGFDATRGDVYYVPEWQGRQRRKQLVQGLRDKHYTVGGMICSGEPIMTKWKWMLALTVPSKYFLLNENGDYVWLDYTNWKTLKHFVLFRAGLAGGDAVTTLARLFFFPFTLSFLLVYAGWVHLKRWVRT